MVGYPFLTDYVNCKFQAEDGSCACRVATRLQQIVHKRADTKAGDKSLLG